MEENAEKSDLKLSTWSTLAGGAQPSLEQDHLEMGRMGLLILPKNEEWNTCTESSKGGTSPGYQGTALVANWVAAQQCSENVAASSGDVKVLPCHGSPSIKQGSVSLDGNTSALRNASFPDVTNQSVTDSCQRSEENDIRRNHCSPVPDASSRFSQRYSGRRDSELQPLSHSKQRTLTMNWDRLNSEEVNHIPVEPRGVGDVAQTKSLDPHYFSNVASQSSVAAIKAPDMVAVDSFCTSGSTSLKHSTPAGNYLPSSQPSIHGSYFQDGRLTAGAPSLVHSVVPGVTTLDPVYIRSMASLGSVCQQKYLLAFGKTSSTDPEWGHSFYAPLWHHPGYTAPHMGTKEPAGLQNTLNMEKMDSSPQMDHGPRLLANCHQTGSDVTNSHLSSLGVTAEKGHRPTAASTFPSVADYSMLLQAAQCTALYEESAKGGNGMDNTQREMPSPSNTNKQKSAWLASPQLAHLQGLNHSTEAGTPSYRLAAESKSAQRGKAAAFFAEQNLAFAISSAAPSAPEMCCSTNILLPDKEKHEPKVTLTKNGVSSGLFVNQRNATIDNHVRGNCSSHIDSRHSPLRGSKHQYIEQASVDSSAEQMDTSSSSLSERLVKGSEQAGEETRTQPYILSNHTKLKKAWMTRHSEQFNSYEDCSREQAAREGMVSGSIRGKGEKRKVENEWKMDDEEVKKQVAKERYEYTSEEEDHNFYLEGLRPKQQLMETSSLTPLAGDGAVMPRQRTGVDNFHVYNGMSGRLILNGETKIKKLRASPEFILQDTPCFIMPAHIQRCRKCWPVHSPEQQEGRLQDISCRFRDFRRLSLERNGGLKADGFATWAEAAEQYLRQWIPDESEREGLNVNESKYLLSALGDLFCKMVGAEKDAMSWIEADSNGSITWKKTKDRSEACDFCHGGFFNTHWMCSRCGFQVCLQCYSTKRKQLIKEKNEGQAEWLKCARGRNHDVRSLITTQFVPSSVVVDLWRWMHDVQAQFDIKSRCACGQKCIKDSKAQGLMLKEEEVRVSPSLPLQPMPRGGTPDCSSPKEESKDCSEMNHENSSKQNPVSRTTTDRRPKVSEHCSSLCDLLASTAVKLSLGSVDIGMAFSPVSPMMPSYDRAATILDSIIARVVERKIQEKLKGSGIVSTNSVEPMASHAHHSLGGLLWLHDPLHKANIHLFQESWRQHQPVLVSGSHRKMKSVLWRPQTLLQEFRGQTLMVVNCRNQATVTEVNSSEFWDGFLASAKCSETADGQEAVMKSETDLADMKPSWMEDLYCSLPLPEYSRNDGKLNLISHLPVNTTQPWLRPRLCAAYGVKPENCGIGTTYLNFDQTDAFNILVHVESTLSDWHSILKDIMLRVEEESIDDVTKERLQDPKNQPGALWHIYSKQDADKIKKLSLKVCEEQGTDIPSGQNPTSNPRLYLDQSVRKRLCQEFGVKGHTVIQFLGDTIFLPAGAPYQVQCFASCVSVSQGFLSPEHATCFLGLMQKTNAEDAAYGKQILHQLQLERLIYHTVKNAVGTLRRQRKEKQN